MSEEEEEEGGERGEEEEEEEEGEEWNPGLSQTSSNQTLVTEA